MLPTQHVEPFKGVKMNVGTGLTLRRKLLLSFGLLVVMLVALAIAAIYSLSASNQEYESFASETTVRKDLVWGARAASGMRAVAVRNMVLSATPETLSASKRLAEEQHRIMTERMAKLKERVNRPNADEKEKELFAKLDAIETKYAPVALAIVELGTSGKKEEAANRIINDCQPLLDALSQAARDYVDYMSKHADEDVRRAGEKYADSRLLLISICVVGLVLAISLSLLVTRQVIGALGAEPVVLAEIVGRVAAGDLTTNVQVASGDSNSVLSAVARMQASLVTVVSKVRNGSESVASASTEIAQGNNDLSARTEQQASALEETAASMEELNATVKQNAENARQADQLAQNASSIAVQGGEVVTLVVDTMKGINESSRKIADIIQVIDGIAFQTNILALNAAVEAARAGEQGRGFAVVASEVRSLAGRSAEAAKEIKTLIDDSVSRVEQGSALVDRAGSTMTEIVGSIRKVTDIVGEISSASKEQSTGVSQVGEAITQMDQVTQQNAALVEEMAAAAGSLKSQASDLVRTVSMFKLSVVDHKEQNTAPIPNSSVISSRSESMMESNILTLRKKVSSSPVPPVNSTKLDVLAVSEPKSASKSNSSKGDDDWETF